MEEQLLRLCSSGSRLQGGERLASHPFGKSHLGSAKIRGSWKFLRYENKKMNHGHTENYILNHRIVCFHI